MRRPIEQAIKVPLPHEIFFGSASPLFSVSDRERVDFDAEDMLVDVESERRRRGARSPRLFTSPMLQRSKEYFPPGQEELGKQQKVEAMSIDEI